MKIRFSYQSECHCAKTSKAQDSKSIGLVTSQNVTAPKPIAGIPEVREGLVTSQNVTAPKRHN